MTPNCRDFEELLYLLPDGELTVDERSSLEQHLLACPDCQARQLEVEQLVQDVRAMPAPGAPEGFRQRVERRLEAPRTAGHMIWLRRLAPLAAAGLLLATLVLLREKPRPASPVEVADRGQVQESSKVELADRSSSRAGGDEPAVAEDQAAPVDSLSSQAGQRAATPARSQEELGRSEGARRERDALEPQPGKESRHDLAAAAPVTQALEERAGPPPEVEAEETVELAAGRAGRFRQAEVAREVTYRVEVEGDPLEFVRRLERARARRVLPDAEVPREDSSRSKVQDDKGDKGATGAKDDENAVCERHYQLRLTEMDSLLEGLRREGARVVALPRSRGLDGALAKRANRGPEPPSFDDDEAVQRVRLVFVRRAPADE